MSTTTVPQLQNITPNQSFFHGASHIKISGNVFGHINNAPGSSFVNSIYNVTNNFSAPRQDTLNRLYAEVAPSALHNAGGRIDPPRCYPGTREEVMKNINNWIYADENRTQWILWLSGPAGAGKSAIMQTLAERFVAESRPVASFFFFRSDRTRNRIRPLVATLAYQMMRVHADTAQIISGAIESDPFILDQSIEYQIQSLIVRPLLQVHRTSGSQIPFILLIDGLDECDSQSRHEQRVLIHALHSAVENGKSPFVVILASRPEPYIATTFSQITSPAKGLFLDKEYRLWDDIRRFVVAEFTNIKKTHHLAHTLRRGWPSQRMIHDIVSRSSGQFVYAATVMRFVRDSTTSPAHSLDRVRGLRTVKGNSPFLDLDAIYRYILSKADDLDSVKDILASRILEDQMNREVVDFSTIYKRLGHDDSPEIYLSDLLALVKYDGKAKTLLFYHASFEDFLVDRTRSREFHIDAGEYATRLLLVFLNAKMESWSVACFKILTTIFDCVKKPTMKLTKGLSGMLPNSTDCLQKSSISQFLHRLAHVYYHADITLYQSLLRKWLEWFHKTNISTSFYPRDFIEYSVPHGAQIWSEILSNPQQ